MCQPDVKPRKVLAGPFVGEFGWELFCWQGFLRKMRSHYDHMTVISRVGKDILYKDFADEFIPVDISTANVNMYINHGSHPAQIVDYYKGMNEYTDFIPYDSFKTRWWLDPQAALKQQFIKFGGGTPTARPVDILIHVRDAHHCGTEFRNWRIANARWYVHWAISKGFSVACVGKRGTSLYIENTLDYRNFSLEEEVNLFSKCSVVVGSQSGPHHLAMLCGTPVITWQTKAEHAVRLQKYWNPFNVKTWVNYPLDNSYWDNKTKNTKHWTPDLEWLQTCTMEALTARK